MANEMKALLKVGEVEQAKKLADTILSKNPNDKAALITLAKLAALEGDYENAGSIIARATLDGVDDVDSLLVKAALAAQLKHDIDYSKQLYEQAIAKAKPPQPEPYFGLGMLLASVGHFAAAAKAFETAVSLDPTVAPFQFHLARALLASEKLPEALPHLEKAIELNPFYLPSYDACVIVLTEFGYLDAAEQLIGEGLKLMPEHPHLLASLGNLMVAKGNVAEAVTLVKKVAIANPTDPFALTNYARLLGATGQPDAALELVKRLELSADVPPQCLALKGMLLEAADSPDEDGAIVAYAKAAQADDSDWKSLNNLGHLLLRKQNGDEQERLAAAVDALQEACRRAPYRLEPILNLALAFARLGKKDLATAAAQDVVARAVKEQADLKAQAEKLLSVL